MKWFGAGAGRGLYQDAFDGLREPAAVLDAEGRVLFANRTLMRIQGCLAEGRPCRERGRRPCSGCLAEGLGAPVDSDAVQHHGRLYQRTVSPFGAGGRKYAVLWRDITASAETEALLKKQYDKMRRDIFHSRNIQYSLLPKDLARAEGYLFKSLYKPSEEMSGDIFDLIRIGRDNMAFYIADVAGHGVTAAMLSIFFSTAVRLEMRPTDMPGKVLSRIHNRFMELELEEHHYITAFLGRLELSTGKLYWSNAGHICPPLLMDAGGNVTALEMAGLPVSRWFRDQEFATASGEMEPGGRLVLFSDGREARWHGSGTDEDLNETVSRILRQSTSEECLDAIWKTVGAGADEGMNRDDTTLLLVNRLKGSGNEAKA
jgi:sigma-B regulation protein RsbU (phosphoserine phosphatase)